MGGATTSACPAARAASWSRCSGFLSPTARQYSLIFSRPTAYRVGGKALPTAAVLIAIVPAVYAPRPGRSPSAARARPSASENDRDRAAVHRPGHTGDVRGRLRAQEGDHRRHLAGLGQPPDGEPRGRGLEHLLPGLPPGLRGLIGQTPRPQPQL